MQSSNHALDRQINRCDRSLAVYLVLVGCGRSLSEELSSIEERKTVQNEQFTVL